MEDLAHIKESYPNAWAAWSAYAMKIKPSEFKKQDWFKVFFQEQNIEYAEWAVDSAFKTLEIKLTQSN